VDGEGERIASPTQKGTKKFQEQGLTEKDIGQVTMGGSCPRIGGKGGELSSWGVGRVCY